ncbi:hypothetical protein KY285_005433 [Solanum tuberosum]|nr:hypothetical protein KY284_005644 [Solanum tuberosum]KAH0752285.1 hypothetical protein KY285_005433 [Solanum tuberosum]
MDEFSMIKCELYEIVRFRTKSKKENQKLEGYYRWENKPRSFACPWPRAKHARAVRFEGEKSKLKWRQGNRVRIILGLPDLASLVRKKM